MRMQDDWDPHRKPAGDTRVQPPDERRSVQQRTFTRWMNVFLQRRDPPVLVQDLFKDIQDGRILMVLLEELSGCKLLYRFRSSSHRIFRLNNISKALSFLDDRHVKLFGIDASGVADGTPSVVLNLVWNIILHFQVKEVTGGLQRHSSLSSLSISSFSTSSDLPEASSSSCSTLPSKGRKAAREPKYHGKTLKRLLLWIQQSTNKFGVEVNDFGRSWRNGLAFLALIKSINPGLVDLRESLSGEPRENLQLAFMTAQQSLDVPPLLEPEDVMCSSPDEQSIITYVSMFLDHHSSTQEDHPADADVPEIPGFGSVDPVGFGETLADDPEARSLLRGLERSSEQQLWRRWSRRSSGSPQVSNGAPDPSSGRNRGRSRRVFQPPSPLDAAVANQEVRLWLEKGSDQNLGRRRPEESRFSLSSEEGSYILTALDSDEEDAYRYILDLNKDEFQPHDHPNRQVEKVEEETVEEVEKVEEETVEEVEKVDEETVEEVEKVDEETVEEVEKVEEETAEEVEKVEEETAEEVEKVEKVEEKTVEEVEKETVEELNEESEHPDGREAINGHERRDLESEVIHEKPDLDGNESSFRDESGFDLESERRRKEEEDEEERLVGGGGDEEEMENTRLDGCEETQDDGEEAEICEAADWWKKEAEEKEEELREKRGQVSEEEEERQSLGNERREAEETGNQNGTDLESLEVKLLSDDQESRRRDDSVRMEKTGDEMNPTDSDPVEGKEREEEMRKHTDVMKTAGDAEIHDGDETCSSDAGFSLQPCCDVTPSELEMLLIFWILLYCCFLLPQISL